MIFKKFGQTFAASIYSPAFYAGLPKQKTAQAFNYFFILALGLTLIMFISSFSLFTGLVGFERDAPTYLASITGKFPPGLAVTIKGGHATSNVEEPYFIAIPPSNDGQTTHSVTTVNSDTIDNIIVIDTKTPFSSEQFTRYRTMAWLGSDSLYYYSQSSSSGGSTSVGRIQVLPLSNVPDVTIDQAWLQGWSDKLLPWLRGLAPVGLLLLGGLMYVLVLFKLVYLFILALWVWGLTHIMGRGRTYWQSYVTGLYAASLGFVIAGVAQAVHHELPFMVVTALSLIIVGVNLSKTPKKVATASH